MGWVMITRKQSIEHFSLRMDELISSNYLLADKKITNILKTVTASKLFYELICFTATGFSYENYLASLPKGQYFPLDNKKNLIAFGFSLFSEIDQKNEDLLNILSLYYKAESFDKMFKLFADNFLMPFKNIVLDVANELLNTTDSEEYENSKVKINPQKKEPTKTEDSPVQLTIETVQPTKKYLTCYRDIQKILISEKGKIIHCKHVKDAEKSDLLGLLDRFKDCLFRGNKEAIKTAFIGYKYAITAFKRIDSEVDDIERILKFCDAI